MTRERSTPGESNKECCRENTKEIAATEKNQQSAC
jgi:hypothetical protein